MATRYSPKIVTEGLVLCLDAANYKSYPGSGITATDLSNRGNTGTLQNGTGWSNVNGGVWTFNGSSHFISTPLNIDANPNSLCAWFYCTDVTSGGGRGVMLTDNGGWDKGFGTVSSQWEIHSGDNQIVVGTYAPVNNRWYYGCMMYTNVSMNFFVDLVYVYSGGAPGATSGANLEIGRAWYSGGGGSRWWQGNIGFVQVYNRALTFAEITQNYNATKTRYGIS